MVRPRVLNVNKDKVAAPRPIFQDNQAFSPNSRNEMPSHRELKTRKRVVSTPPTKIQSTVDVKRDIFMSANEPVQPYEFSAITNSENPAFNQAFEVLSLATMAKSTPTTYCRLDPAHLDPTHSLHQKAVKKSLSTQRALELKRMIEEKYPISIDSNQNTLKTEDDVHATELSFLSSSHASEYDTFPYSFLM
ncbi:hypothetical protein PCE1_001353 [Barthelona sp. PCE]